MLSQPKLLWILQKNQSQMLFLSFLKIDFHMSPIKYKFPKLNLLPLGNKEVSDFRQDLWASLSENSLFKTFQVVIVSEKKNIEKKQRKRS